MELVQSIPLKSIKNARELGGYPTLDGRRVKSGVLLRTAKLCGISDEDVQVLTEKYRLQDIVDFRMDMELLGADDPEINGVRYNILDVIDLSSFNMTDEMSAVDISSLDLIQIVELTVQSGMMGSKMYITFLSDEKGKKAYSKFFRILLDADSDRAVLWHCTSGKDRTGLGAMLLLSALGVDEEIILDDYTLTNKFYSKEIAMTEQLLRAKGCDDEYVKRGTLVFDAVDKSFMQNAIDYLKDKYGSVKNYILSELNVTADEIEILKAKYLV